MSRYSMKCIQEQPSSRENSEDDILVDLMKSNSGLVPVDSLREMYRMLRRITSG